jgi:hypothetical protein
LRLSGAVLLFSLTAACAPPAPDAVLLNGHVFTANPAQPWAEAVAIRGERVIAVGTTAEVSALASSETRTRDLGGRAVIPASTMRTSPIPLATRLRWRPSRAQHSSGASPRCTGSSARAA